MNTDRYESSSFPNSVWERFFSKLCFVGSEACTRNRVSPADVPKRSLGTRAARVLCFLSVFICVHLWLIPLFAAEPVPVGPPEKRSLIRMVEQPGRIDPFAQTPLLARISGYVKAVHAD